MSAAEHQLLLWQLIGCAVLYIFLFGLDRFMSAAGIETPRLVELTLIWFPVMFIGFAVVVLNGCAPEPRATNPRAAAHLEEQAKDASVILLCSQDNGDRVPCCSAFVARAGPTFADARIYTADHCLRNAGLGSDLAYVSRDSWERTATGHADARIVERDTRRDRAALTPIEIDDAEALAVSALDIGVIDKPEPVRSVGAYDNWRVSVGLATEQVWDESGSSWISSLDVQPGWSGAPVIDDAGRVVGIATRCRGTIPDYPGSKTCESRTGIFVALGDFR